MDALHAFELGIAMILAIIALRWLGDRLRLPPTLALLTGGAALAFLPGLPAIAVNPELVLVIFLPPLLMDGAWTIPLARLRRHKVGIASLAVGAVVFTTAVVAAVTHWLFPALPWAACAALGAVVAPPDAVAARAVLERVTLPRRLQILLEGESLLNDAAGLVVFRFAVAAAVTGTFSVGAAVGTFVILALGGAAVGLAVGFAWLRLMKHLRDEYLKIAATMLLSWIAYIAGEAAHVSGVIATVTAALFAAWHQHTAITASERIRGTSFWTVSIFFMEAAVFVLIGLSLRDVAERGGGFVVAAERFALPVAAILGALVAARFAWVFASDLVIRAGRALGVTKAPPFGLGCGAVLSWAGIRGVVTLALALSVPANFPGRDLILVTAFAAIAGTVLIQGTTLGWLIAWAKLSEPEADKPRLTMSQAEASMAQAQIVVVRKLAYDADGELVHPMLLRRYETRAEKIVDYAEDTEAHRPMLHAHFDVVLAAVAAGRAELIRLHRAGEIEDATLHELERDLDLEELSALAAKA